MSKLYTEQDLQAELRAAVEAAGGAKKWCKKNNVHGHTYSMHMISDGRAATMEDVMRANGYRRVYRYEKIEK